MATKAAIRDDRADAVANIQRAFKDATRDAQGRVIVYTIRRTPSGFAVFTISRKDGMPMWLMWSVSKVAGYRLCRSGGRDMVILNGGNYSKADELADSVARAAEGSKWGSGSGTYRCEEL